MKSERTISEALAEKPMADLLAEYVEEKDFAKALGVSVDTIKRARKETDGIAYMRWRRRIFIHVPSAREWIRRRLVNPNPSRGSRRRGSARRVEAA